MLVLKRPDVLMEVFRNLKTGCRCRLVSVYAAGTRRVERTLVLKSMREKKNPSKNLSNSNQINYLNNSILEQNDKNHLNKGKEILFFFFSILVRPFHGVVCDFRCSLNMADVSKSSLMQVLLCCSSVLATQQGRDPQITHDQ